MDWNARHESLLLALQGARVVSFMDTPTTLDQIKLADDGQLFPGLWQTNSKPATDVHPKTLVFVKDGLSLIFLQGVKSTAGVLQIARGYSSEPTVASGQYWQPLGLTGASQLYSWLESLTYAPNGHVRIFGHSFGGLCAVILADLVLNITGVNTCDVITYGSPRQVNGKYFRNNWLPPTLRYYNDDDPIIRVCPQQAENPVAYALLPAPLRRAYTDYRNAGYPRRLTDDNAEHWDAIGPSNYTLPIGTVDLVGWMTGVNQSGVTAHAIGTYVHKLLACNPGWVPVVGQSTNAPLLPIPISPVSGSNISPELKSLPNTEVQRLIREAVQEEHVTAEELGILKNVRYFRPGKVGSSWCVNTDDGPLRLTTGKRKAKSFSRRGNRMVTELKARGETDFESAEQAVRAMI